MFLRSCGLLDGEELARVVVPVAFLLDKDLAAKLTGYRSDFSILVPDFLARLKLPVFQALLLHAGLPAFFALRRQLYQ